MKTSLDIDDEIFVAFRAHCRSEGKTVTGALEKFMRETLSAAGKLPNDPLTEVAATATELARTHGAEAVQAKLGELALAGATAAGEGSGK